MSIDFTGVEEEVGDNKDYPAKLSLGVHETTISGVTFGESSKKGTPYAEVEFVDDSGATHSDRFYITPKALMRLKSLLINVGIDEDSISGELPDSQLVAMLTNKKVRILVGGREFISDSGETRIAKEFPFRGFSESVSVPSSESTLAYSEDKHLKRLETSTATPNGEAASDFPF